MITVHRRNARQAEIIIKSWPYKHEDINNYCKSLGKPLIDLNYDETELMISELNLWECLSRQRC